MPPEFTSSPIDTNAFTELFVSLVKDVNTEDNMVSAAFNQVQSEAEDRFDRIQLMPKPSILSHIGTGTETKTPTIVCTESLS